MSDYNTKLAIEDWKSNGENGIEINRLYYMKFDHEVESINEKLNDTRFMTGFSYTKIDTTFQELVNDLATLNAYIVKVLDEIDEKIDEPYYQELNRGVLEDLERIKLEDFTIPNNLGITEEKYITVNDPTAQYGVTTTKVRTEKKELTLEDMLNNYEMDGTQGFKTFTDMYRDQFKSMQQATDEMKDLDFNDYVNAVIHQADYQHTVDAGWLNTLGDVLDVVGITSIIGSFTGTNVFTGEILTDSERSAAIFSAVINVGLLVLTVATAGVGSVVAAGVKVTASAIAKQVAKSLIIDMIAGIGGMAATHVLQSIGAPPWLAAVVGIGVSFAGGFSGQKVLDAVTSKQAVNSLLGQGIRNVDDLLASGRNIDDLLKAGIKPKAFANLGIHSADDFLKLGVKSVDDFKKIGFTIKDLAKYDLDFIDNLIVTPKGMVIGKIPLEDFQNIRAQSLHNVDADTLLLGKYEPTIIDGVKRWDMPANNSYNIVAGNNGHTYFDLGSEWDSIQKQFNLDEVEMFDLFNRPALDDAIISGKTIVFSHNPLDYDSGAIVKEWEYIKNTLNLTDNDLHLVNGLFEVSKK
ncbi:pre-toxin TG domain-containing protein [Listeria booriae]|uniref:pre-toxin TG domain-containing protein n=1 Tax=Listeria booriae TaxID=1552123 RepID=UPI0016265CC5|nr:pre-toxin TG domain-containing protein [Listeria booriae]MBC2196135.1 hypothetical protein [Listeria booriae]